MRRRGAARGGRAGAYTGACLPSIGSGSLFDADEPHTVFTIPHRRRDDHAKVDGPRVRRHKMGIQDVGHERLMPSWTREPGTEPPAQGPRIWPSAAVRSVDAAAHLAVPGRWMPCPCGHPIPDCSHRPEFPFRPTWHHLDLVRQWCGNRRLSNWVGYTRSPCCRLITARSAHRGTRHIGRHNVFGGKLH